MLGVVQWSALTRVLRELVSNVIQHSSATHLEIAAALQAGTAVRRIGQIEAAPGLRVVDAAGRELALAFSSFDHFA